MPRQPKPYVKGSFYCTSVGGVPHQKLCHKDKGRRHAEVCLARLLVQRADRPVVAEGLTVVEAHDEFLDGQLVDNRPETYQWYRDKLKPFFERYGLRDISSITHEDGLAYKRYLAKEREWVKGGQKRVGLGNTSVNAYLRAAKGLLSWASKPSRRQRTGLLSHPWEELKYLEEKPRERVVTAEEFQALLDCCTDGAVSGGAAEFREILQLLRHTTMRPGELRKLRWEYIDWDEYRVVYPADRVKTGRRREVALIDAAVKLLRDRRERLTKLGLPTDAYVFSKPAMLDGKRTASASGEMTKPHSVSQRFTRLFNRCAAKGLVRKEVAGERLVMYSSRHTRITEMFVQGLDQAAVMFDSESVKESVLVILLWG